MKHHIGRYAASWSPRVGVIVVLAALIGCVAAIPVAIRLLQGEDESTATAIVDRSADEVYATALRNAEENPSAVITATDPEERTIVGTSSGRPARAQVIPVSSSSSQIFITVERGDDEAAAEAELEAIIMTMTNLCDDLGLRCRVAE